MTVARAVVLALAPLLPTGRWCSANSGFVIFLKRKGAMRKQIVLVGMVALFAIPSIARADAYIEAKGGVFIPTVGGALKIEDITTSLNLGGDVELALGWTWAFLGLQVSAGYLWTSAQATASSGASASSSTNGIPFNGILQLRLPLWFIQPYIEGGAGGYASFINLTAGGTTASHSQVLFMALGGLGVDFFLGPVLVGAEARYFFINPTNVSTAAGATASLALSGVSVTANLGYIF